MSWLSLINFYLVLCVCVCCGFFKSKKQDGVEHGGGLFEVGPGRAVTRCRTRLQSSREHVTTVQHAQPHGQHAQSAVEASRHSPPRGVWLHYWLQAASRYSPHRELVSGYSSGSKQHPDTLHTEIWCLATVVAPSSIPTLSKQRTGV